MASNTQQYKDRVLKKQLLLKSLATTVSFLMAHCYIFSQNINEEQRTSLVLSGSDIEHVFRGFLRSHE